MEDYPPYASASSVVLPSNLSKALSQSSTIFDLNLSHKGILEIKDVLESKSFSNLPIQEMRNSQFKLDYLDKRYGEYDKMAEYSLKPIESIPDVDEELCNLFKEKLEDPEYLQMIGERTKLPIYEKRKVILDMVECNQVVLLSGDTGCGKTTQVPQFILDEYISSSRGSECKIICTQPRRISAISVAERVAKERAEDPGISCGYHVRVEKNVPRKYGSMVFVTNGIVLRFMESNPTLNGYSHLILDEIHERDIHTDFLLTMVKRLITIRKDIKVILMSATLNEHRFSEFFDDCPHLKIDRLSYSVVEYFLEDVVDRLNYRFTYRKTDDRRDIFSSNVVPYVEQLYRTGQYPSSVIRELLEPHSEILNLDLIYTLTMEICRTEPPGAILIFVTGYDDIKKLKQKFIGLPRNKYIIISLHSQLPIDEQKEVFEEAPAGLRKIIISTNIAETSVTIDDVVYVIDSGWSKVKTYDPRTKSENLETKFISKANAIQRKGRAGRTRPGKCFRLYTRGRFNAFFDYPKPEILRSLLEGVILQSKLLGFKSTRKFFDLLLDQPKPDIINRSMDLLCQIGAVENGEDLTPLGYYIAKLPMSPQLAKILIFGIVFRCLDPILNIVVGLDFKSPFNLNLNMGNQGDPKLLQFSNGCKSDHLLLNKALFSFVNADHTEKESLCDEQNLNKETLYMLESLKHKFMEHLLELELVPNLDSRHKEMNLFSENLELLKSVVCAGLYPNIVLASSTGGRNSFFTVDNTLVGIHKKSVLASEQYRSISAIAFYLKLKSGKWDLMHDATIVSPFAIYFFGNVKHLFRSSWKEDSVFRSLKSRFQEYLLFKLTNPGPVEPDRVDDESRLLKVLVRVLSSQ